MGRPKLYTKERAEQIVALLTSREAGSWTYTIHHKAVYLDGYAVKVWDAQGDFVAFWDDEKSFTRDRATD